MSTSAPLGPPPQPQAQFFPPYGPNPAPMAPRPTSTRQVPNRCPVCEGRGNVPAGFYTRGLAEGTNSEECKQCAGTGLIYTTETTVF